MLLFVYLDIPFSPTKYMYKKQLLPTTHIESHSLYELSASLNLILEGSIRNSTRPKVIRNIKREQLETILKWLSILFPSVLHKLLLRLLFRFPFSYRPVFDL